MSAIKVELWHNPKQGTSGFTVFNDDHALVATLRDGAYWVTGTGGQYVHAPEPFQTGRAAERFMRRWIREQ